MTERSAGMAVSSEEQLLIARAIRREPEAFAELYTRHYDYVLRRVLRIAGNRYDAEDLTSEAFLRAWNSIDRFEDRGIPIAAWFSTIAEHLAFKHVKNRRPSIPVDETAAGFSTDGNPDQVVELSADAETLRSALAQLSPIQQEVISKRFLDDASYSELVVLTGKPAGTVRVIQHRALKALRQILLRNRESTTTPVNPAALN